jgi:hypothetical protein
MLERAVEPGSMPSYAFFVLLICSAAIATFGLLANSAAVIIGAMNIAPRMNPIISLSYGIMAGRLVLSIRSILTIVMGTLLTIGLACILTAAGLDLTGWSLRYATDVSANGNIIVGWGTNSVGGDEAWLARLATVPEPSAFVLAAVGLLGLAVRAHRPRRGPS